MNVNLEMMNEKERYCFTEIEINFHKAIEKTRGRHERIEEILKKINESSLDENEKKSFSIFLINCTKLYLLIMKDGQGKKILAKILLLLWNLNLENIQKALLKIQN